MAYELRNNSGSLFRTKERKSDNAPNLSGKVMVGGKTYYIDAWSKETRDGNKWLSLSFKEVKGAGEAQGRKRDDDDGPPF